MVEAGRCVRTWGQAGRLQNDTLTAIFFFACKAEAFQKHICA